MLLFLAAGCFSVRKCRKAGVLNRDQTEEWKGWMQVGNTEHTHTHTLGLQRSNTSITIQFAFLAYHYHHAAEMYNLIRVFVSSYGTPHHAHDAPSKWRT